MTASIVSVTVDYYCDGAISAHLDKFPLVTITAPSLPLARAALKGRGWGILRSGYERTLCPSCYREHQRLVKAGALDKRGVITDMELYDHLTASP